MIVVNYKREVKIKTMFKNADNAMVAADVETKKIFECNYQAEQLFGYSRQELIGMHRAALYPAAEEEAYKEKDALYIAEGRVAGGRGIIRHKDGRNIPVWINALTVKMGDKEVVVESFFDLAGNEKEIEMKRYYELFENAINSLVYPFYVLDVGDYSIKIANFAARVGSLSSEAATCYALTHKRNEPCCGEHICPLTEVKRTKQPVVVEHIHYDQQGNPRNVEVHAYPVFDKEKSVVQMIEYSLDITERKKMEQDIRQRKEYAELLFRLVPIAIFTVDRDRRITSWNKKAEEITGYSAEEVAGKECLAFALSPCKEKCGLYADDVKKPVIGKECTIRTKNGQLRIVSKNADILKDEKGNVIGGIESFDDITQLKQTEEELKKAKDAADIANRTKSGFLANMSHELRTPLNAIIGFSELLRDESFGPLNDRQKEYVTDIWQSGKHPLSLINDILDLSKVEAGKMELELGEFDVKKVLESSISMIKEKAMRHNISIVRDIRDDMGVILADERKFKQIMFNLLSNAAKFTPDGGKIGIEAKITEDKEVLITVWDTGIGIEENDKARIFKEFEQIDSSYSRKYAGTGLGMSLTKKFVELHGGKIWFESDGSGKGSRFSFILPKHSAERILYGRIENGILAAKKDNKKVSVFAVRFDNYSQFETAQGAQKAEDFVLKALRVCEKIVKAEDFVIQNGKDQIVITGMLGREDAPLVSMRIKRGVKSFIFEEDADIEFSYGFSVYPDDGDNSRDLLAKAFANFVSEKEERLKKSIMIVDDEPNIVNSLERFLKGFGYSSFIKAHSGEEALGKLKSETPDLILLDMLMPDVNGYEVIGNLKADPRTENIPILIISGYKVEIGKLKGYVTKETTAILGKPLNMEDVEKTVRYMLR